VAWLSATGGESYVVDIREAREGDERELVKYTVKAATLSASQVVEFAIAMSRSRRISTGGSWYGAMSDDDLLKEEEPGRVVTFEELERAAGRGEVWALEARAGLLEWGLRELAVSTESPGRRRRHRRP